MTNQQFQVISKMLTLDLQKQNLAAKITRLQTQNFEIEQKLDKLKSELLKQKVSEAEINDAWTYLLNVTSNQNQAAASNDIVFSQE